MRPAVLTAFFLAAFLPSASGQAVITNSGSTNRPGMSVTVDVKDHEAMAESRGTKVKVNLQSDLHSKFMQDLEAAAPVDQLKASHCAKSASFGSSTFVTYKGVRSPDISCPEQTDPLVEALRKDVEEIVMQAHSKIPALRPR